MSPWRYRSLISFFFQKGHQLIMYKEERRCKGLPATEAILGVGERTLDPYLTEKCVPFSENQQF